MMIFPKGFFANGVHAGIGSKKKRDMSLFYSSVPCAAAGLFTENKVKAAPVLASKKNLAGGMAQAIIANSGSANCCTGKRGMADADFMGSYTARLLGINKKDVLIASTGLIGSFLPMARIRQGIESLCKSAKRGTGSPSCAVEGIMTTDTFAKISSRTFRLGGKKVVMWGCAKGAGMIEPHLATMLCFILTDADIGGNLLKRALKEATDKSFNLVTVDGETSTNDSVFIMANGRAGNRKIEKESSAFKKFAENIDSVLLSLAKMIARDGEGATRFVEVRVEGCKNRAEGLKVAKRVASSPLIKTAIFGSLPNWGRVMSAIGMSGINVKPRKIDIYYDNIMVTKGGCAAGYPQKTARRIVGKKEFTIRIDLNAGREKVSVWTCDFSPEYVKINAGYWT